MNLQDTDIAIIGAGLAGSTAAAMLGRGGYKVTLVDPSPTYRPEFKCEKLDSSQIELLARTGLSEAVLSQAASDDEVWVVRYGRLVDRRPSRRSGIMYADLVNAIRRQVPGHVKQVAAKANHIDIRGKHTEIDLSDGSSWRARLVVLATGLNPGLRSSVGIECKTLSRRHTLCIGFDIAPGSGKKFMFPALTYFPDSPEHRCAYLTLFPTPHGMRANLFAYWEPEDPRLQDWRHAPQSALDTLMPGLKKFAGDYVITGRVAIRPIDLIRVSQPARDGMVMVGDAYSTSCPAAGTGANKVLTDINLLASTYIPRWLEKNQISAMDVDAFYCDPAKLACEDYCYRKALRLREMTTSASIGNKCWRAARFAAQSAIGAMRPHLVSSKSKELSQFS
jgi:2-polyprenyl-6-methoxyphenol hydroxylase-like FAD-dependent oxidoreductase